MYDFPASPSNGQQYGAWTFNGVAWVGGAVSGGGGGLTDGDKGDIVVSGTGATWEFDATVVTPAAKTVLDDTTVAAMRTTLGAEPAIAGGTTSEFWRGDKTWQVPSGGGLPLTGGTLTGNLTISAANLASLTLNDTGALSIGNASLIAFKRGGVNRFAALLDGAETGSGNTGSDWVIARYSDAGTYIDQPVIVDRTSGDLILNHSLSIAASLSVTNTSVFLQQVEFKQVPTVNGVAMGGGGAGVTDGDKGDIVVSASGATWLLDSGVVTAAAKTVLDDASTAAMLTTLGAAPMAAATTYYGTKTISTSAPSGGADGDVWYQVV